MKKQVSKELRMTPEQIQVFTPTPSTLATAMYYTELDGPYGNPIFVEKDLYLKRKQMDIILADDRKGPGRR
jgi:radical SAM superfamily enzyme YgiQ (UPF0313 family)